MTTRALALRGIVASLLGYSSHRKVSEATLGTMCEPVEDRILATVYGLADDAGGTT